MYYIPAMDTLQQTVSGQQAQYVVYAMSDVLV